MFCGIIETVGTIREVREIPGGADLWITAPFAAEVVAGESVAVAGACLTVTEKERGAFRVQAVRETLARTTLGQAASGTRVNLERSLRPTDRIGGHFVMGHVDATARILEVEDRGAEWVVRVEMPEPLAPQLVEKGSVAIDGVSLTVAALSASDFSVCLVPFTRGRTTLGEIQGGERVNIETDLFGKHAARVLLGLRESWERDPARGVEGGPLR